VKYGIGIDIGGTKISIVLGTSKGKILLRREIRTRQKAQAKKSFEELLSVVSELIRTSRIPRKKIAGIGIGMPGAVNPEKGVVPDSPDLKGWKRFPIRKRLQKKLRLPVRMTNDANAAVVGEKVFGCGKKAKNLIYMTVSTGIGGGLIVNNQLVQGSDYVGGEVGHMVIAAKGNRCKCGQQGCLEAYASGTAIQKFVETEIRCGRSRGIKKFLKNPKKTSGQELGFAAKKKNPLALEAYRRGGFYLGVGIGTLLNLLNPELVVLGGGVWKSAPKIFEKEMKKSIKKHSWPEALKSAKIRRTALGDHVGNLGALALVFEK